MRPELVWTPHESLKGHRAWAGRKCIGVVYKGDYRPLWISETILPTKHRSIRFETEDAAIRRIERIWETFWNDVTDEGA